MRKQHDKQFKEDAVKYYIDHKELALTGCSKNLGIGGSTLSKWLRESNKKMEFKFVILVIMVAMNKRRLHY